LSLSAETDSDAKSSTALSLSPDSSPLFPPTLRGHTIWFFFVSRGLLFGVLSLLFALVNANHAGIPELGEHPRVSRHGRNVGILFAPVWAVSAVLNLWAFAGA